MTPTDGLVWSTLPPAPDEYVALRAAAGLGARSEDSARRGLGRELLAITLRQDGRLLAMGRVLGDGGCFALIADMAVHPDLQGHGVGREMLRRLLAWCEASLPPDCHLSLVSSERAAPLYEAAGFRPCRGLDRYADPARPSPP